VRRREHSTAPTRRSALDHRGRRTGDRRSWSTCATASQVEAAVAATSQQFGGLHLVVNNAGVVTMSDLDHLTDDEWDFVVDVNLKGQFIVAQVASRSMTEGGAIVNLSTVEAAVVVSSSGHCQPHYNASKGGVPMLTKALAVELAAKGIRVNAVAPGPINTRFSGGDITGPEAMAFMSQRLLVPRVGEPVRRGERGVVPALRPGVVHLRRAPPVDGGWFTR
jgi:2-hydroxycyclohexanecarboxyl-CoA dehydrogenase